MRLLPGVVIGRAAARSARALRETPPGRRRLAAAIAAAAAAIALTGCAQFDAALGQRQAVVTFRSGTPVSQRLAVRAACGKLPRVTAQRLPSDPNSPYALQQLTFQVNHASDAEYRRPHANIARAGVPRSCTGV